MSPSREQLAKLANDFIAAYNTNTPEGAIAFRSSDCRHSILPTTADFPNAFTNEEYKAYVTINFQRSNNFHLKLSDVAPLIVDVETRTVVMYLTSSAETAIGLYQNEYVYTLRINDDGTEIKEIIEYFDSAFAVEFLKKLKEHEAEKAEVEEAETKTAETAKPDGRRYSGVVFEEVCSYSGEGLFD